jgi:hypothetical protein
MRGWTAAALPLILVLAAGRPLAAEEPTVPKPLPGLNHGIPAAARPYVRQQQFTSPLTGESFMADLVGGGVPPGSYDYDFCPHPPFNTFAYALVTDPATGWTAFPDQFMRCPFTAEQVRQAVGAPKFNRKSPDGLPWLDPYPWEQFENAALLGIAANQNQLDTGNLYVQAAWAVRLDVITGNNEFDSEVEALFKPLPRHPANPGEVFTIYELQLAATWEQERASGVLKDIDPARFALAMAWLYRSRGELQGAEHWLDEAAAADPGLARQGGLYSFLRSSARLERTYLKSAQAQFSAAWEAHRVEARRMGLTAYALGEISRRLGDLPGARNWYAEAERYGSGALNLDKLRRLEALAGGRGY